MLFPTPYQDVNATLYDLLAHIQAILGSQFVGLYLYGSLALGDFDPETSDIDLIVVTQSELAAELISALREMHRKFDQSGSSWATKIEAAYLPLDGLKHPAPPTTHYPQVERGKELFLAPLEMGWAFQRFTLREQGIVVYGPKPITFTDPTDQVEMKQAAVVILSDWQEKAHQDADWIAWVWKRSCQAFVILTICRLIYSLETGSVGSKPVAALWAQKILGPSRETLIQRALASQQDEDGISDLELKDTLDLLDEALEQSRNKW